MFPNLCAATLRRGFTLVELLTVMTICGLLLALIVPALGFKSSRDATKAVYDIDGILEQARACAVAQNTCVWVGLHQLGSSTGEAPPADATLLLAVAASRDGSSKSGATNLTTADAMHTFMGMTMTHTATTSTFPLICNCFGLSRSAVTDPLVYHHRGSAEVIRTLADTLPPEIQKELDAHLAANKPRGNPRH